jgi:hypothetical protein
MRSLFYAALAMMLGISAAAAEETSGRNGAGQPAETG